MGIYHSYYDPKDMSYILKFSDRGGCVPLSEIKDITSNIDQVLSKFQEDVQTHFAMKKMFQIDHILVNGDYTTVIWKDKTNTVVKRAVDESDDPEKALLFAMLKKICGNNGSEMARYLKDADEKTIVKEPKKKDASKDLESLMQSHSLLVSQAKALRDRGFTYKQISEEMKIPVAVVRRYLAE